jgi:hypothetical protein
MLLHVAVVSHFCGSVLSCCFVCQIWNLYIWVIRNHLSHWFRRTWIVRMEKRLFCNYENMYLRTFSSDGVGFISWVWERAQNLFLQSNTRPQGMIIAVWKACSSFSHKLAMLWLIVLCIIVGSCCVLNCARRWFHSIIKLGMLSGKKYSGTTPWLLHKSVKRKGGYQEADKWHVSPKHRTLVWAKELVQSAYIMFLSEEQIKL